MKKAVVLLSGGLDSATVTAIAKSQGCEVFALTFLYGQRHDIEMKAAQKVAQAMSVAEHKVMHLDLRTFGGSCLTSDAQVPKDQISMDREAEDPNAIPSTYVPARNTIFLSYALAYAEVLGANDIYIGANVLDYSGYPDCRPEYIEAFEAMANLATASAVSGQKIRIHAPLIHLSKSEIIRKGIELDVNYGITHSCYDPVGELACGRCDSCLLRHRGFIETDVKDPTLYVAQ